MQSKPVFDKDGNVTGLYQYDGNVAARSLENIGKHVRFFPTDVQPSPPQNTVNVLVASPEWLNLRSIITRALQPFPEAREAVVEALREAEVEGPPRLEGGAATNG